MSDGAAALGEHRHSTCGIRSAFRESLPLANTRTLPLRPVMSVSSVVLSPRSALSLFADDCDTLNLSLSSRRSDILGGTIGILGLSPLANHRCDGSAPKPWHEESFDLLHILQTVGPSIIAGSSRN